MVYSSSPVVCTLTHPSSTTFSSSKVWGNSGSFGSETNSLNSREAQRKYQYYSLVRTWIVFMISGNSWKNPVRIKKSFIPPPPTARRETRLQRWAVVNENRRTAQKSFSLTEDILCEGQAIFWLVRGHIFGRRDDDRVRHAKDGSHSDEVWSEHEVEVLPTAWRHMILAQMMFAKKAKISIYQYKPGLFTHLGFAWRLWSSKWEPHITTSFRISRALHSASLFPVSVRWQKRWMNQSGCTSSRVWKSKWPSLPLLCSGCYEIFMQHSTWNCCHVIILLCFRPSVERWSNFQEEFWAWLQTLLGAAR